MKPQVQPPRFVDHPQYGESVRAAANLMPSSERMAHGAQRLEARLVMLPVTGGSVATSLSAATVAKLGGAAALFIGVSVIGVVTFAPRDEPAVVALPAAQESPGRGVEEPETPIEAPAAVSSAKKPSPPNRAPRQAEVPAAEPSAELAEQLRLYQRAHERATVGDHPGALAALDELERRFPAGALGIEAKLARIASLVAASRDVEALQLLEASVELPAVVGKKAQLLRMMGEIYLRQGDCVRARRVLQQALGLGLEREDATAAQRGMALCTE